MNYLNLNSFKKGNDFIKFQEGKLKDVQGFCKVATTKEIAAQDYILTPGRYVGIEQQQEDTEPFKKKMKRLTSELNEMFNESNRLQKEIRKNLESIG